MPGGPSTVTEIARSFSRIFKRTGWTWRKGPTTFIPSHRQIEAEIERLFAQASTSGFAVETGRIEVVPFAGSFRIKLISESWYVNGPQVAHSPESANGGSR